VVLVWCVVDFATAGQGTLAPIDPPTRLVTRGLYRYVRNPMYWGVGLLLLGQSMLFASWVLFTYLVTFGICAHLFVVLYEEPALTRKFGTSYEEFLNTVPRWWPRRPTR
jgi:protein-S-isoprenylcysteine O-methyltransferase Ste14